MELVLSVGTQTVLEFFISCIISWMYLVFLFGWPNLRRRKASLRGVISTVDKELSRFFDTCLSVLRPYIGFRLVFKPIKLNLDSITSDSSCSVDWCFYYCQNLSHQTTFFNLLRETSKPDWTYIWGVSGTNHSEVPLQMCWTSLWRFSILEAWAKPWAVKTVYINS